VKRAKNSVSITAELKDFLESGVSVVVGTCDAACVPEAVRAWGPRVGRDQRSVSLCVALATSGRALNNLRESGRIAVTFCLPTNYKTIQLKGRYLGTAQLNDQDLVAVERHRDSFLASAARVGVHRRFMEGLWQRELLESAVMLKIRFVAEQAFDQTPGPNAGRQL
jgi:hypothetical protein